MAEKITEKMVFMTQIMTSWDGAEQRMALRSEPRRYISYDYLGVESWHSQYLRMLTFGQQTQLVEFPLWHAASPLQDKLYKGQASVRIEENALWGYRNIGGVELWTTDKIGGLKYGLKYMTASGMLGINKQVLSDWEARSTTVIPVAVGVLSKEDKYVNLHSCLTSMTVNLELIRNQNAPTFPASFDEFHDETVTRNVIPRGLPDRYLGVEVFKAEPPLEDDISSSYTRNANRLDNETGIFRFDLKSTETTETKSITYLGLSKEETHNFQRFFYRCKGMLKSFWAPTWLSDLELIGDMDAGQIYLLVKFNMYWKYYAKSKRRRTLVIFYWNGTAEILKIAGYTIDDTGQYGKLYLDNPLAHVLEKKKIEMISYFCRYRFASDELITDYETTGIARINFGLTEVDE